MFNLSPSILLLKYLYTIYIKKIKFIKVLIIIYLN